MVFVPSRPNGTLPGSVEIQNNTIYFKGPVSYSVAGTYVCEATNAIGTRSGLVEVNVTGRTAPGLLWNVQRRWGGRQRCEQLTSTSSISSIISVSFQGGNFVMQMGQWSSWLCAGVAMVCLGFFFFSSFPLVVFSFLTPTQFVPPLPSALDSERLLYMLTAKARQGDIDQDEGQDEDGDCQKGRRWMSHLFRMLFGVSGVGQFS